MNIINITSADLSTVIANSKPNPVVADNGLRIDQPLYPTGFHANAVCDKSATFSGWSKIAWDTILAV